MHFEKVAFKAFYNDTIKQNPRLVMADIASAWQGIRLPQRQTTASAGYDICTPYDITIPAGCTWVVPTGIKACFTRQEMKKWHLQIFVRSSIGIKDGVVLMNGTGIIDGDYQFADNDGDIHLPLINTSHELVKYKAGDRLCQAVFMRHGVVNGDTAQGSRHGGMGSTGI